MHLCGTISFQQRVRSSNISETRIGAADAAGEFVIHAADLQAKFAARDDQVHRSVHHVAALLERGVRVLVFVGAIDWTCNWVGASLVPHSHDAAECACSRSGTSA